MNTTTQPFVMSQTSTGTGQLVDRFGRLKAEASDIATELDSIKATLIDREGECKLEGELFRLSLSHTLRSTTDWKAVALYLAKKAGISDKQFDTLVSGSTTMADTWVARANARITK